MEKQINKYLYKSICFLIGLLTVGNFPLSISAEETVVDVICGLTDTEQIKGYDLSAVTAYNSWEFWVLQDKIWKKGSKFTWSSSSNANRLSTITKVGENEVKISNFLRDFQGLFPDGTEDITGIVDVDNLTITIPVQAIGDGYYIGQTMPYDENGLQLSEIEPLILNLSCITGSIQIFTYGSGGVYFSGGDDPTFALYYLNEQGTGYYANIGYCTINNWTNGSGTGMFVEYSYEMEEIVSPTSDIVESLSLVRVRFENNCYANETKVDDICITKDGEIIDVDLIFEVDRNAQMYCNLEFDEPITEPGVYAITFPKGLVGNSVYAQYDYNAGLANKEITLTFTIEDTSGIEAIQQDSDAVTEVYTLQGMRVAQEGLAPGVYIFKNGNNVKKAVVR